MKRTYSATRNGGIFPLLGGWWSIVALVCAVLLLCIRLFLPNVFVRMLSPLSRAGASVAAQTHSFLGAFGDVATLTAKVDTLTQDNQALANENRILSERLADAAALAGGSASTTAGSVLGVLARPPESAYDTLLLAGGTDRGVSKGMEVFGSGGTPIGVISAVTASFSRATLFSAPGNTLLTWVGAARIPVTLTGEGGGAFSASVLRNAGVQVGDVVYAPGPGALPVGSVVKLSGDPSAPSVSLDILPVQSPYTLSSVLVRDTGAAFQAALVATTSAP